MAGQDLWFDDAKKMLSLSGKQKGNLKVGLLTFFISDDRRYEKPVFVKEIHLSDFREEDKDHFAAFSLSSVSQILQLTDIMKHDNGYVYLIYEKCGEGEVTIKDMFVRRSNTFWNGNEPKHQLLKLIKDVMTGVDSIHRRGVLHGDLRIDNIFVAQDLSVRIYGVRGNEKLTDKTIYKDLCALGHIILYCLTGSTNTHDSNHCFLVSLGNNYEAMDCVTNFLACSNTKRVDIQLYLKHPMFWTSSLKRFFFNYAKDKLSDENLSGKFNTYCLGDPLLGRGVKWLDKIDDILISNLKRCGLSYGGRDAFELVRFIRNTLEYWNNLSQQTKMIFNNNTNGIDDYFMITFPSLITRLYGFFTVNDKVGMTKFVT